MSTAENVDPELVEQTKQQIRNLVREIAQLSKSDLSPVEFYDQLLNRIVSALAAAGGAVWVVGEQGSLEVQYQINLRDTRLADSQDDQLRHGRLLRRVLTSGEGMLAQPHSGTLDGDEAEGNPTDFLMVLGPLKTDTETRGVVEVFQRPGGSPTVQRGYLRFLLQMCEFAGDFLKTRQLRSYTSRQTLWSQLDQFTRVAHRSLDPRETAYVIANEGRRLLECDRVSVAIKKGRRCYIEAVSGQDTFDKRSTTVQLLGEVATAVAAAGEPVWYTGDTSDLPPQVEDSMQAYVDEAHSKTVAVVPLFRTQPEPKAGDTAPPAPPVVIGCLIVEQIEDSRPREGLLARTDVVSEHSSTALANALEYHGLFLLPLWKQLGKARWVLQARTLPKTIAVAIAAVALLLWLGLYPAEFWLTGKGTLQPAIKREVFAGIDGVVMDVKPKHGEMVDQHALLAEMRNTDLEVQITDITGQRTTTQAQILATQRALLDEKRIEVAERHRLSGQLLQYKKTFDSLGEQLKLLYQKKEELKVKSPIKGQVVTWQVRENLIHRPVQRGQILMTIADPAGDWELEINMPENRMGYIAIEVEQRERLIKEGKLSKEEAVLPVEYILATKPGSSYEGGVKEIEVGAAVKGEEGNTVLVRVAIDKQKLLEDGHDLRPGATVTTKIYCGRASIGYVWLHDLIAFVQTKILFPL